MFQRNHHFLFLCLSFHREERKFDSNTAEEEEEDEEEEEEEELTNIS